MNRVILMHICCIFAGLVAASECPTSSCDPATLLVPLPAEISLQTCTATVEGPVALDLDPSLAHLGDEGYELHAHQEGYRVAARTKKGLFYGHKTAEQMKRLRLVPCTTVVDKPVMAMRGVMLDLARLKERHEYYYHVIDQLAEWKINTVFLHLTDHSGCALEIKHYPKLATKYAFSQAEMLKLIRYAAERHIEIIPEIETWGHAKYITSVPDLADLAEDPKDPRALCTSNPRTWEVLGHIIDEVAALFPSKYIHVGCDEAAFGKCTTCASRIEREGADALVAEHLKRAHDLVAARGKQAMMWGDVLLAHRGAADVLPKDTIVCHWDYKPQPGDEPVKFLKSKGFEVIGCPAIVWGSRMILPRTDTLDNVANFSRIVHDAGCLGMETAVWVPQRYITDTLWFSLAYAAELSWSGPKRTRLEFAAAFAKSFFGIAADTQLAQALLDAHELSMKSFAKLQDVWAYAEECSAKPDTQMCEAPSPERDRATDIAEVLRRYRPRITEHETEYDALILAADIRAFVETRGTAIEGLVVALRSAEKLVHEEHKETANEVLARLLPIVADLAKQNESLTKRLEAAWDRWRYPDDPKKHDGGENLLGGFYTSGEFLGEVHIRLDEARRRIESGESVDWQAILKRPKTSS